MEYAEFRRHLGKAGMTVNEFASYLGVRPASVSNYSKAGEVPRSYAMLAVLLGDAADRGAAISQLLSRFGLVPLTSEYGKVSQLNLFRSARESSKHAVSVPTEAVGSTVSRPRRSNEKARRS